MPMLSIRLSAMCPFYNVSSVLSTNADQDARRWSSITLTSARSKKETRASEACFLLRTLNPVERLARDGVLSEKEAQLSRMFLHVAQGVQ